MSALPFGHCALYLNVILTCYLLVYIYTFLLLSGVEDGQTVRMPVGRKELFITFRVAKSNVFRRDGADIHSDATVSFTQAALGGNIRIKGIYDTLSLDVSTLIIDRKK